MRRADELITAARIISRNAANADGTYSISDDEILQYLNDGQDRLQNLLSATKNVAKIFVTDLSIPLVAGQEAYTVADRVLLNKQIELVEFSYSGLQSDYTPLEKLNFIDRDTTTTNFVQGYIKRGNQLLLQPTPAVSQGVLRVSFERELDDLDTVRARVNGTPSGTDIDLTHSTGAPSAANEAKFVAGRYICITSATGVVLLRNGVIASYNATTDVLTLAANVSTYLVGAATLASLADGYLSVGQYTTVQSLLPDNCERYLVHYAAAELFRKDSSNDYKNEISLLGEIENDIIKALSSQTSEIQYIPSVNRYEYF